MSWNVPNPKGRVASVLSIMIWGTFIALIVIRSEWELLDILFLCLFALLLVLSLVRAYQEWKEQGEWLE